MQAPFPVFDLEIGQSITVTFSDIDNGECEYDFALTAATG